MSDQFMPPSFLTDYIELETSEPLIIRHYQTIFNSRSDDNGWEPVRIITQVINGRIKALIKLHRITSETGKETNQ